jgi:hypothetical protein
MKEIFEKWERVGDGRYELNGFHVCLPCGFVKNKKTGDKKYFRSNEQLNEILKIINNEKEEIKKS